MSAPAGHQSPPSAPDENGDGSDLRADGTVPLWGHVTDVTAQSIRARVRVEPSGCHVWTGALNSDGYGYLKLEPTGRAVRVARVTWTLHHAQDVPIGMLVDHVAERGCVSRACVNPEHLEAVTPRSNTVRGVEAAKVRAGQLSMDGGSP